MAKKKATKKKSNKSHHFWKSWKFILVAALIAGGVALYYSDYRPEMPKEISSLTDKIDLPDFGKVEKEISHTADKAKDLTHKVAKTVKSAPAPAKAASKKSAARPASTPTSIHTHLEIPVNTVKRNEELLRKYAFTISYNNYMHNPNWVAWELTRKETEGKESRKSKFEPDPELRGYRVTHSDYTHTRFDRGHMAPAADMKWSKRAMQESFYTTNICPQNQSLNRGDWNDLEEICRAWAKKYGTVYIACGPVYKTRTPKRLNKGNIAIPDQFFKVVLIYNRKNPIAMGFLFDNVARSQSLKKYMVTVDSIEALTGLDFFSKVPDDVERRIEAIVPALPSK